MSDDTAHADILTAAAQNQVRSIVERLERLDQEKAEIAAQIKEVLAEAKGNGLSPKHLRKAVALRKIDRIKRQEDEAILDLYMAACGELPLFERTQDAPAERGIDSVTLNMGDGRSITGTPDQLAVAERMVRGVPEEQALYDQAVALVRRDGKASISYVQRRLQLGFNTASGLVERMQRERVVGAPNAAGKREIIGAEAVH